MRKIALIALVATVSFGMVGCASIGQSQSSPAAGAIFTSAKGPVTATDVDGYSKTGTASANSILGLVGIGDASIQAAASEANISEIHNVDQEYFNILGIYARTTTVVYGN